MFLKIIDTVNFEQKHDSDYHRKCPANNYNNNYVGETGQRILERIMDHSGSDVNLQFIEASHVKGASMSSK